MSTLKAALLIAAFASTAGFASDSPTKPSWVAEAELLKSLASAGVDLTTTPNGVSCLRTKNILCYGQDFEDPAAVCKISLEAADQIIVSGELAIRVGKALKAVGVQNTGNSPEIKFQIKSAHCGMITAINGYEMGLCELEKE